MSGGLRKGKTYFFVISICLHFERPVEVAQMKTTHSLRVVVAQRKSLVSAGNVVTHFDAKLQYRSKVSYHPSSRFSRLAGTIEAYILEYITSR